ncbi:hypothetical protein GCK72_024818 [Caenorhabditis remanei]|uniref:Uncharacterized protein n=3 Tax=Caenorhabditis TaxID=6237 RepID=E3LCM1_CAERE|nr:hypothetical protein GCK72_024818 [Caenorhabditis remanei]EFO82402.1 hypothetical protein CRE_00515 [Caenorhabditis remanei]KAF1748351.1 hypothetical protein GCK72_024818 [Caenorhabditis remanei]
MSHWIATLLAFVLIANAFAALSTGADVGASDDVASYVVPFYGMEKKWSRREPSIRFFKRNNGGQDFPPSRFLWDY